MPATEDETPFYCYENGNKQKTIAVQSESFNIYEYFKPYSPYPWYGTENVGKAISVLKTDGTWDIVYTQGTFENAIVNVADLNFHYPTEQYARSYDGNLRIRISNFYYKPGPGMEIAGESKYYVLNYLPQKVEMKLSKVKQSSIRSNDYYRDVNIGMNRLEGATRIVVSQLDYGEELPYTYEILDFRNGYFETTVDKDFPTKFKITAFNKNGQTESEEYTLPPVDPSTNINIEFRKDRDKILLICNDRFGENISLLKSYELHMISSTGTYIKKDEMFTSNEVDISSLKSGIYTLTVYDIKNESHSFKFTK